MYALELFINSRKVITLASCQQIRLQALKQTLPLCMLLRKKGVNVEHKYSVSCKNLEASQSSVMQNGAEIYLHKEPFVNVSDILTKYSDLEHGFK